MVKLHFAQIAYPAAFLAFGYLFGKLTCNVHFKRYGFWITTFGFILINGIHSMIDGVAMTRFTFEDGMWSLLVHELIRQPVLYAILLAILAPFAASIWVRYSVAIVAVTGIWIVGMLTGAVIGHHLENTALAIPYLRYLPWILYGDIIHHGVDWIIRIWTHPVTERHH